MLYIFDNTETLITTLPKGSFFNAVHYEVLNGENTFEFTLPAGSEYVVEGNLVAFRDLDSYWQIFEIKRIVDVHGDGLTRTAYCEHIFYELLDDIVIDKRPSAGATAALDGMLDGTRWQVGIVDDLGASSTSAYYEPVLSAVQKVANAWKGELNWRCVISGGVITRYVDLLAQRGTDTGKQFVYSKDILSIEREVDSSGVVTALYGRGKGIELDSGSYGRRLTFADVVAPDKPAGQEWIGDADALAQWGRPGGRHRFGVFVDEEETDPAKLLQKTRDELGRRKVPRATYRLDVVSLEELTGYEHEAVRLGDLVRVIDREFKPELVVSARVIEIERDILDPANTKVVLGSFAPTIVEATRNTQRRVDEMANRPFNTKWLDGKISVLQNEIENVQSYVFQTADDGILILDAADYATATKAMKLGGGIFAIANQKDGQGGWNWRTFGDGSGFTADLITAGIIDAGLVQIGPQTTFAPGYDPSQIEGASAVGMGVDADCLGLWHFDGSLNSHKGVAAESNADYNTGLFGQALNIATGKHLKVPAVGLSASQGTISFRAKNLAESVNGSVLVDLPKSDNTQGLRAGIANDGKLYITDSDKVSRSYTETSQADFQSGTLTDVVATSASDLELKKDVFSDNCSSVTGWTMGGEGTAASDGNSFYVANYGSGSGFHGPTLTKTLGASMGDITCIFDVTWLNNITEALGVLRISLLDSSDNETAFIQMRDDWAGKLHTVLMARAGSADIFNTGSGSTTYNNYSGTLKLVRKGSTWTFYAGDTLLGTLTGGTTTEVTQIKLTFQQYSTYSLVTTIKVNDISIITPYKPSGTREKIVDISGAIPAGGTSISWSKTTPTNTTVKVETALSTDGGSTYGAYQEATSGSSIPGITSDTNLSNARLKIKETLETTDVTKTPQLHSLSFTITESEATTVYGPNKSTLTAWDSIALAWKSDRLSLVVNDSEACYIENPGLPTALGSHVFIGTDRNGANAINTLVDELRIDKVYREVNIRTGWHKTGVPFYTSEDMKQWPGYLRAETDGLKVYDSSDDLRVLVGSWLKDAVRKYGIKIIDGEIYSSLIRSGAENASSYIQLTPPNRLEVFYNNALQMLIEAFFGGRIFFYHSGEMVSQIIGDVQGADLMIAATDTGRILVAGDLSVTGTLYSGGKSNIEITENYGIRTLVVRESPDHKYIVEGVGEITNGTCRIDIEPMFLECIEPNTVARWIVQLTPYAQASLWVSEIADTYFVVSSDIDQIEFAWTLSAYRKNFADIYLPEYVSKGVR